MTKETETKLLQDVAETKGLLVRLTKEWDDGKRGFASCSDVQDVKDDLKAHIDHHKWSIGQIVAVIMGGLAMIVSFGERVIRKP